MAKGPKQAEPTKKETAAQEKAPASDKPSKKSEKAKKNGAKDEPASLLSKVRPKRRLIFFVGFVLGCLAIIVLYDTCGSVKKKQDCGYEGISAMTCITYACFWQGSNGPSKSTLKVPREDGAGLGLELSQGNDAAWYTVRSVGAGAVQDYNAALPDDSEKRILEGDVIWKLDGSSGNSLMTALQRTTKKTISIVTSRSSLPKFLHFLHNPGKPSMAERVLFSTGSKRFFRTFSRVGGVGFSFWAISGYPVASLPSYFVISALTSFVTTRCCHDDRVGGGVPHCYKGGDEIEIVVQKVTTKALEFGNKVAKDPKSYADFLLYGS